MQRRQPLPRLWLITDERQGEALWTALDRLPAGAGVVFRHYGLARQKRRTLFERVRKKARRRRLLLLLAGPAGQAAAWGADGSHGRGNDLRHHRLRSAPAHNLRDIRAAERAGADLLFVSPVFRTRSHPGGTALGPLKFALLAAKARLPVIALGGVNASNARRAAPFGIYGWAAIDAWSVSRGKA
jgi:thiamine-phosphate pyrophosphorylase